jgi:hypothetical protein
LSAAGPAAAAEDEANLEFFYPLRTRRAVIERELEFKAGHEKARDGSTTETSAALELPILPRWQIEIEVPFIFLDPRDSKGAAGFGDIAVANKFLVYKSVEHRAQLALGVEARFPSGSERRGLGGEAAIEPFVAGAIALGDFDVLASAAYEFNINSHVKGPNEQQLGASTAVAWRLHRFFTPLVELVTLTRVRGDNEDGLCDRTQVYIVPGFNSRPLPGMTFRLGLELPLTNARTHEYAILGGLVKEF